MLRHCLVLDCIFEGLAFVLDRDVVCAVFALGDFGAAYDLGGNAEAFAGGDYAFDYFRIAVDFHAVAHVVNAEHFLVAGATGFLDGFEDRRDGQEVVFDDVDSGAEAQAFGLAAAGAMHHTVNRAALFFEQLLDDGRIRAGWTEQGFADSLVGVGERVFHLVRTAVEELLVGGQIAGLRIFFEIVAV